MTLRTLTRKPSTRSRNEETEKRRERYRTAIAEKRSKEFPHPFLLVQVFLNGTFAIDGSYVRFENAEAIAQLRNRSKEDNSYCWEAWIK
jgi:hypothetical protein